jgi:hypothetical protein
MGNQDLKRETLIFGRVWPLLTSHSVLFASILPIELKIRPPFGARRSL